MAQGKDAGFLRHVRTLSATANERNDSPHEMGSPCCLRYVPVSVALSDMAKSALGKGLSALIGNRPIHVRSASDVDPGEKIYQASLDEISPSPLQPRKEFGHEALQELVDSIRQHGIIQPLIVRQIDGRYELIAGERRWRAAQELGLREVPVIVRRVSDLEVLEISLIENLQRADLNPVEKARAMGRS